MHRLEKHIKQIRGISYSPDDISDVPVMDYLPILKANNIQDGSLKTDNLIYIHKSKIKPEQFIKKGDILIAASSGSKDIVGKSVFFDEDFDGGFGAFCKVIRPASTIYPKFVSVFFKTPEYKRHIRKVIQGANINNLRTEDIDGLKIPLFPLSDQIKIAQILTQAEKLIARRKESIALLDEYLKSTFLEMFGDPVKNEKGWEVSELKHYAKVRIGPFGSLLHREDYVQNGVPLVNPSHISEGKIFIDSNLTISKAKMKELSAYIMREGDVVLGRRGEIGRCAVVTKNEDGYLCGTGSIYIRPTKKLNSIFLYNVISAASTRKVLENSAKGITMKNLNSGIAENLKLPIPPPTLQTQFAQIAEKTEALKSQYQHSLRELEQLFGSLSQRAFKGELDLSRMEVSEDAFNISDTPPSPTPPKSEKITKERPQVAVKEDTEASIWLSNRKKGKTGKVPFTPVEGNAVLTEFFNQGKGFRFQAFETFLKNEGFEYAFEQVKDFLFEKLEQKELLQYYSNVEWMEERYRQEIGSDEDDFSSDGRIWLVVKNKVVP